MIRKSCRSSRCACASAERVVKTRVINQRLLPAAIEPRGCVADFKSVMKSADQLTLWASTQVPHSLRTHMTKALGLPEHSVRVIAPEVGGGFGNKIDLSPHVDFDPKPLLS